MIIKGYLPQLQTFGLRNKTALQKAGFPPCSSPPLRYSKDSSSPDLLVGKEEEVEHLIGPVR